MKDLQDNPRIFKLISIIANAESSLAYLLFRRYFSQLQDYKFVFAAKKGGLTPGSAVNRTFSAGASVRSVFKSERVWVLDRDTVQEIETTGMSTFSVDYSIALDTQAFSYLEPYILPNSYSHLPKDFQEVFEFIARDDVNVDPLPYVIENFLELGKDVVTQHMFNNWKAYEILRTIDTVWLRERGKIRSTLTEYELNLQAQQWCSGMLHDRGDSTLVKQFFSGHQLMYACLLKIVLIHFTLSSTNTINKIDNFMEFCDSQLATMYRRVTAVAREYFDRGQNLRFFGKIQKCRRDLLKQLRNMAWDLVHAQRLEVVMPPSQEYRYFFPALLTFDKRFIEMIDLYPVKAYAFKVGDYVSYTFPERDWDQIVSSKQNDRKTILERYFSVDASRARGKRRDGALAQLSSTVAQLEDEVRVAARIPE